MTPELTLAAIVLVPVVVLMLLRINAALVFLSLCLGNVLVQFLGPDLNSFAALFSARAPNVTPPDNDTLKIALLVLPALLTAIFMIRTVHSTSRLLLNVLPAAGVGLLGGLLVVPLLPAGLSHNVVNSPLWGQAQRTQALIVGGSALVCLLVLWMQRPKAGKHAKHK